MTEFEFTAPLTPEQKEYFQFRYGQGELERDTSEVPFVTEEVMQSVYDHYNLHDSPHPKIGYDKPIERAIQTSQHYFREIKLQGNLTLREGFEDLYDDYFSGHKTNMNIAAISAGFVLYSFNKCTGDSLPEFVERFSRLDDEITYDIVTSSLMVNGRHMGFPITRGIFDVDVDKIRLPHYQIHLDEGIEKLRCNDMSSQFAIYDGAVGAYNSLNKLWPELMKNDE